MKTSLLFSMTELFVGFFEVVPHPVMKASMMNSILIFIVCCALLPTFGGMCSWRRVAVARVFALVVRCRVIRLVVYSRVGKNRDTRRESPGGAAEGNDLYRPVRARFILVLTLIH